MDFTCWTPPLEDGSYWHVFADFYFDPVQADGRLVASCFTSMPFGSRGDGVLAHELAIACEGQALACNVNVDQCCVRARGDRGIHS